MATELDELCGRLTLSEGEKEGIQIEEGEISVMRDKVARSLVGRLGTDKKINREAFRILMLRLWKPTGTVIFKEVQDHLWIIEFSDGNDKDKVLSGRPWLFDRSLLVLHDFDGITPPSQISFSHSPFWIQIHDMPLVCMNREVGLKIGASMGEVIDIVVGRDGAGWGRSLRVRIMLDVTKPLERGRALRLDGKSVWVSFKYEKLPIFCFQCGRILHDKQGCPNSSRKETGGWRSINGVFGCGRRIRRPFQGNFRVTD
ncbi:hypothetical protein SLA2020_348130 [Shorea laevis]